MPGTHAEPLIVAIADDAHVSVHVSKARTIVSDAGAETVGISVLATSPDWATILTLYATRAGAEKLRDALLDVLPLPEPEPPAPEEVDAIMQRAHDDVKAQCLRGHAYINATRALRLDGPGREALGRGLVTSDTAEWLGEDAS